ncbi:hypothetical protein F3Y22_tig00110893pilonHSYRG00498 [Hibiscus syriacus]|uniref:Uncharacterized protein n=1 Tax=Hibiscus syriacus TaxID=106335 RepID=A0A6A2ZFJ0_HIBSY|nr:uncharacterized protein LOC120145207 [Hibiscus syriacus]XP_039015033.1 uncharacterized protein LOC120145207 [Hibiscus syriacus]KAE8690781.1 hypothetical protein F3Y22_tig00110893pilonHSYRG00498 [Hibiscus syriacus]
MKQCAIQQNSIGSRREEMRSSFPMSVMVTDRGETMVCPKPRRLGFLNSSFNDHPVRSLRRQFSHQGELCDSKPGSDVLDMIFTKGGCGAEESCANVVAAAPFFCGSPPSRAANPLIHDARFGDEKTTTPFPLLSQIPPPSGLSSPSSSGPRKGSCVRANFGNKPAVRVEGFDCLDRDSRNCSIPALA